MSEHHEDHSDHGGTHAGHDPAEFRRRFWVSLILTVPVLVYAEPIQQWLNYTAPAFTGSSFIPLIFGTILFIYGGVIFLRGAWHELLDRQPGMMTLIALGITVSYGYSLATRLGLSGMPLWWELATLIDVMLLGHWIEMRAIGSAQGALSELAKLLPDTAERLVNGRSEAVPVIDLRPDDLVLVRPGARVPADAEVVEGRSDLNESMITGESRPVDKAPGDTIIGGTINGAGSLRARVTRTGAESTLGGIMRIVEDAQASRSNAQALADRAAFWLVGVALVCGVITFVVWIVRASLAFTIERTVTVLVITCPHALGLAIPLVIAISTTLAARNGLLIRDRLALEQAREIDTVLFDKTGTLTLGEQGIVDQTVADGVEPDNALALAAAVEGDSEHPIARAFRDATEERGLARPAMADFEALPGRGVRARVDGQTVLVGGPRLLESIERAPDGALREAAERWGHEGKSVIYLVIEGIPRAAFALADVIRPESREAVSRLKAMGMRVAMITGDSRAVADWVACELGIDATFAEVLPEHKADQVRKLREGGQRVAMVGDGVNDAPALVTADVGIAIGAGTDVAIESAGIILVRDDPRDVARVVTLSRASYRKMLQNLAWATGYNVFAIPLAAGVLASFGILLAPAAGAILMSLSTIIVAINAQLLRR